MSIQIICEAQLRAMADLPAADGTEERLSLQVSGSQPEALPTVAEPVEDDEDAV